MKTNFGVPFVIGLFLIWGAAVPAQAGGVIFSNLGPGDSYISGTDGGWALGDPPNDCVTATGFTAGVSLDLSTIDVAAGMLIGPNGATTGVNQLTISLDADSDREDCLMFAAQSKMTTAPARSPARIVVADALAGVLPLDPCDLCASLLQ